MAISTVPSEWYHLVFNYKKHYGDFIVIYHDGAEVGVGTQKTPFDRNGGAGVVVIGRNFVQSERAFASVMVDELLFFNRFLTGEEVQILYNM